MNNDTYLGVMIDIDSNGVLTRMWDSAPVTRLANPAVAVTPYPINITRDNEGLLNNEWDLLLRCTGLHGIFVPSLSEFGRLFGTSAGFGVQYSEAAGTVYAMMFEQHPALTELNKGNPDFVPHAILTGPIGNSRPQKAFLRSVASYIAGRDFRFSKPVVTPYTLYAELANHGITV